MININERKFSQLFVFSYYSFILLLHACMIFWLRTLFPQTVFIIHMCYLTNMTIYLNLLYYVAQFFTEKSKLQLLSQFTFSISFAVFVLYWSIILINLYFGLMLKFPPFPFMLDILIHGGTFIVNLIEHAFFIGERKDNNIKKNICIYACFSLLYTTYMLVAFHVRNFEVYHNFGKMTNAQIVIMNLGAVGLMTVADLGSSKLNNLVKLKFKYE